MKTRIGLALAISIAALIPSIACAGERATLSIGAGASGSSNSAFRGGWGAMASLEMPLSAGASFLVRGDYHAIPEESAAAFAVPAVWAQAGPTSLFGGWPDGAARVSAAALLAGVRLQATTGRVLPYMDALAGVGYAGEPHHDYMTAFIPTPNVPRSHDDINVALSFGAGMKLRAIGEGNLFLDAHYDFYFVPGVKSAIIPVRLGYGFPLGKRSV